MDNEIKHSEEFIRNLAGKKTGFSTPKNYFNEIENNVSSLISAEKIPSKTKFNVPSDYFSTLEDTILAKISSEEKQTKVISFKERVLRFIPIIAAASLLLFISINYFTTNTVSIDDISTEELTAWFENNSEEINTEELALAFDLEDFDENDLSETTIDNDNLEEYLNSIDSSTLYNEIQ